MCKQRRGGLLLIPPTDPLRMDGSESQDAAKKTVY